MFVLNQTDATGRRRAAASQYCNMRAALLLLSPDCSTGALERAVRTCHALASAPHMNMRLSICAAFVVALIRVNRAGGGGGGGRFQAQAN